MLLYLMLLFGVLLYATLRDAVTHPWIALTHCVSMFVIILLVAQRTAEGAA